MTIMGQDDQATKSDEMQKDDAGSASHDAEAPKESAKSDEPEKVNIFSESNLKDKSELSNERTVIPEDKIAFVDSVVQNKRFMKSYSLFGGKVSLTVRSLTSDEVNAMSAWILKQGSSDSAGLLSGRYRKYLAAAQVEELNGVRMNPLEEPLFETLGKDGKSVECPGWISRSSYWDGMSGGLFDAVMACIKDFDELYSLLCKKAQDSNFWNPDTP